MNTTKAIGCLILIAINFVAYYLGRYLKGRKQRNFIRHIIVQSEKEMKKQETMRFNSLGNKNITNFHMENQRKYEFFIKQLNEML